MFVAAIIWLLVIIIDSLLGYTAAGQRISGRKVGLLTFTTISHLFLILIWYITPRSTTMITTNYSYYAAPLFFLQTVYASLRGPLIKMKLDNNIAPRDVLNEMEKSGKYSPRLIAKLRRREGCEKNMWEGMPMILASTVCRYLPIDVSSWH